MVAASEDLVWLLVRNHNSRMVKVPNQRPLSKEHSNVANVHSFKYSGLASSKPVTIKKNAKGIEFSTRKNKATPNAVKAAANTRQLSSGKPRKNAKTVYTATQKYRPDLTQAAMSRVTRL